METRICTAAFVDMDNVPGPSPLVPVGRGRKKDARSSLELLPDGHLRPIRPVLKKLPCLPTAQWVKSESTIWAQVASQFFPICSQTPTPRSQQANLPGPWPHVHFYLCTIVYVSHPGMAASLPTCIHFICESHPALTSSGRICAAPSARDDCLVLKTVGEICLHVPLEPPIIAFNNYFHLRLLFLFSAFAFLPPPSHLLCCKLLEDEDLFY